MTPDDGETVALQFGGDVMMGRRFFDPNEDGVTSDGLIKDPSNVEEHVSLLSSVAPLLAQADLTAVNVESPISDEPFVNALGPRTDRAHPTKEFVFASGPAMPEALATAGVDVVGLANNHQYDLLEPGVRSTVDGFARAGFTPGLRQFGLGNSVDAAYVPAVIGAKGARFAFLGCTTITGTENPISYVAGPGKGGAAPCDPGRVRDSVAAASASGAVVIFSVHGGFEYGRQPSGQVESYTAIARQAGATLVVNAHPHVVGGMDWDGGSLAAWSLGNLVFDQTVWPTFQSYVLNVHVRRGQIIRAFLEPVAIEGYVARGIRSDLAERVTRTAGGLSRGPFVMEDGALELDVARASSTARRLATVEPPDDGRISEVTPGWMPREATPGVVDLGRDLLWSGEFENDVLGVGPGALWTQGPDTRVVPDDAAGRGLVYELQRDNGDPAPAIGTTTHRLLLTDPNSERLRRLNKDDEEPGTRATPLPVARPASRARVSLAGSVRLSQGAQLELQLSWFADTRGPSTGQTVRVLHGETDRGGWQPLRIDADAPPDAVAVGVFARLTSPADMRGDGTPDEVSARLDAFRLIEWSVPGAMAPSQATHVRSAPGGSVRLEGSSLGTGEQLPPPLLPLGP
ncbi:CapA family protein [Actinomycetospora straminea]|nr:CapA family protein [Actinomycetospora straminea]MDD7931374.1 CapA family protein [Actinomycetospora straminea]